MKERIPNDQERKPTIKLVTKKTGDRGDRLSCFPGPLPPLCPPNNFPKGPRRT